MKISRFFHLTWTVSDLEGRNEFRPLYVILTKFIKNYMRNQITFFHTVHLQTLPRI